MGLQDRDYYQYESEQRFSGFSLDRRSIVAILVAINVAIFFIDAFTPRAPLPAAWQQEIDAINDPAEKAVVERRVSSGMRSLCYQLGVRYEYPWYVWNYLTYGFAHASIMTETGFMHVLGNMITLFFLGRAVEMALGRKEFLRFYLVSIVVCGIGFTVLRHLFQAKFYCMVGASGGVSAVVALFVFMFPRETVLLFGVVPVKAWIIGIVLLAYNLLIALNPESSTAWEAHLIGFGFGGAYFFGKWNLSNFQFGSLPKRQPKLKVHDPDHIDSSLQEDADRILKKISEQGEKSLTRRERKILTQYSEKLRNQRSK
jgi:membrane associated rhomboid family serine protease